MKSKLYVKKNEQYEQLFPQTTADFVLVGEGDLATEITQLNNKFNNYQLKSEKGNANGYASLGSDGKVTSSQLPIQADVSGKEDKVNKGIANGYASLGSDGKVPVTQLPAQVQTSSENFDNLTISIGNNTNTIFHVDGSISEIIRNASDNRLIATKSITFGTGVVYEDTTIYKDDGATIQKKVRLETTFNGDGSILERSINI